MTATFFDPAGGRARRWVAALGVAAVATAFSVPLSTSAQQQPTTLSPPMQRGLPDFTQLVERVGPAVVNIRTIEKIERDEAAGGGSGGGRGGLDDDMLEFFRRFGIPIPGAPRGQRPDQPERPPGAQRPPSAQQDERPRGVGSGFILTADGYVMTNAHVVDGADSVMVTLTDQREFKARIVGADKRSDVAVVKIDAKDLPAVRIGDINRVKVGEWVVAIGSPFGLANTVTAGIISAKQRDTGEYLPLLQTDVAINPGNSGGPLLNLDGEVIGINSQIYSRSGGYMGISFAIPIDEAVRVSDQLRATGRVSRGRIGVRIDQVSKDVAESIGLGRPRGALVRGVEAGSPAEKAGIKAGDIIVKFDGQNVDRTSDLPRIVGNTKPGTSSSITVFRRGETKDLMVTVAEIEAEKVASAAPFEKPKSKTAKASSDLLGLTVIEVADERKEELKIGGGVQVETATGPSARAGLRDGDVIVAVANQDVASIAEFEAVTAKVDKTKPVNILFRRGEWAQYALIKPQ
ncbi:MAG: Do family serine endopeptidase [Burkholderiaceae bacterium]